MNCPNCDKEIVLMPQDHPCAWEGTNWWACHDCEYHRFQGDGTLPTIVPDSALLDMEPLPGHVMVTARILARDFCTKFN